MKTLICISGGGTLEFENKKHLSNDRSSKVSL